MANFITVLRSDRNKSYWKAVQWDDTIESLRGNQFYTAGVSMSIPKNGEQPLEGKTIIESSTQLSGNADIYRLIRSTSDVVSLAANKASKAFIKRIKSHSK